MALRETARIESFLRIGISLKNSKKGVFFTYVATVFLALLIFSSSVGNNYEMRQKSFAIETRIYTMDGFISGIEEDIGRGAYISGFRSLIAMEDKVISSGNYLSDMNSTFSELFFNGTINGTNSTYLQNNTFDDWKDNMEIEAEKVDIILDISLNSISITQDNPWTIRIDVDVDIMITDREGNIKWNKNKLVQSYLELDGFEDPFYMLETNGLVENKIRRTNFSDFVDGSDISNLLSHTYAGYYIEFTGAPSYLMRLQGDFGSSDYGVESLVDVADVVSKGGIAKDKSIVDYIYFGPTNPTKYNVNGAPSWFKLDNSSNADSSQTHHDLYEVNGLVS